MAKKKTSWFNEVKKIVLRGSTDRMSVYPMEGCSLDVGYQKVELKITDDDVMAIGNRFIQLYAKQQEELEQLKIERQKVMDVLWTHFNETPKNKIIRLREIMSEDPKGEEDE